MHKIDIILDLLRWDRTAEEQAQGIAMAEEVVILKPFFRPTVPGNSKSVWENCAVVICQRSDAELTPYLADMFAWLEDLNWPGALLIQERLMAFQETEALVACLDDFVATHVHMNYRSWLHDLSPLLLNTKIAVAVADDTRRTLVEFLYPERQANQTTPLSNLSAQINHNPPESSQYDVHWQIKQIPKERISSLAKAQNNVTGDGTVCS